MTSEDSAVGRILNVFADALGVKVGQEVYVVYRASSRNAPHVKRAKVVQCQCTMAEDVGSITLLCEDYAGARYVYRYDQVMLDLNRAVRIAATEGMREDMGLDEFCRVVDPRFKFKRRKDGEEASKSPLFDPSRTVDEEERQRLLRRVNERVRTAAYWKEGPRK